MDRLTYRDENGFVCCHRNVTIYDFIQRLAEYEDAAEHAESVGGQNE